jgi:RNA polymerase sigma-70 factor (ECF subfamily)
LKRGTQNISREGGIGQAEWPGAPEWPSPGRTFPLCYSRAHTGRTEPTELRAGPDPPPPEGTLATRKELSDFLSAVERRAFKQSVFSVQDEEAALDIVQDAMLKLAEKYAARPAEELPPIFQRILQNAIRDHFRRNRVRSAWTSLWSSLGLTGEDDESDPLETFEVEEESAVPASPADRLEQSQVMALIEEAVSSLPERQRQAFLLRYWEDFDVSETARVMGCSEGSVKTHCSRATHALAKILRSKGITL